MSKGEQGKVFLSGPSRRMCPHSPTDPVDFPPVPNIALRSGPAFQFILLDAMIKSAIIIITIITTTSLFQMEKSWKAQCYPPSPILFLPALTLLNSSSVVKHFLAVELTDNSHVFLTKQHIQRSLAIQLLLLQTHWHQCPLPGHTAHLLKANPWVPW